MSVFVNSDFRIMVDTADAAGFANSLELMVEQEEVEVTPLNAGGYRQFIGGLARHMVNVDGYQSFATTGPDAVFGGVTAPRSVLSVCPHNFGDAVGDPAYIGQAFDLSYTALSGQVGQAAAFSAGWTGDNRAARGVVLHPLAARTATGNGTTVAFANPSATQGLAASFHVTSVSGSGSVVFRVQTDDSSGMSSPALRITSQSFTAVGAQFSRLAPGTYSSETHARVTWTISGFTSVTFFVAVGIS